jgi:hypothetical protein
MFALEIHPPGDRLRSSGNDPLLIFLGSFEQEIVEFFPTAGFRHGHQVVPAKLAALTFHAALFVPLSRCTKLRRRNPNEIALQMCTAFSVTPSVAESTTSFWNNSNWGGCDF